MAIKKNSTIAFSGHRELKPAANNLFSGDRETVSADREEFRYTLLRKTAGAIRQLYNKGYTTFLCGMAEGYDLLAGEAVLELKKEFPEIGLIAVIPHPGQASGIGKSERALYDRILGQAAETITVCDRYRHDCFHLRNDFLVDNSSALVCFYTGEKGGTAYTVKRAIANGLPIINMA